MLTLPFRRAVEKAVKGSTQAPPIGALMPYAASTAPNGWLLCDGSAISRTTYSALFAVISTTYGVGDGATTFNVPNLKGKVVVGFNSAETEFDALAETGGTKTHTLSTDEVASHAHTTDSQGVHSHDGATGAGTAHGHAVTEGTHSHFVDKYDSVGSGGISLTARDAATTDLNTPTGGGHAHTVASESAHTHTVPSQSGHTHTAGATGGSGAHNNLSPYVVLQYIIKT